MAGSTHAPRCLVRGSINIDEFFHVPKMVSPGETLSSTAYSRRGGGKGANQAVAVARAGGEVTLVGAVGSDGVWLKDELGSAGVDVKGVIVDEQEPTGRAIIQLTPEGENAIILHRGANYAAHTDLASPNATLEYTHLLLQNEIPFASTLTFLSHAQTSGAISLYNPSPLPTDDQLRTFPWKSMARGWLLLNEGEAKGVYTALSRSNSVFGTEQTEDLEEEDPVKRAQSLLLALRRLPTFSPHVNLVCTLGPHGAVALLASSAADENHDKVDESEVLHIPAAHLAGPVLDTTGAGDCFTGYFVAGLMDAHAETQAQAVEADSRVIATETVWRALRRASAAAALCVQRRGAAESVPHKAEVDAYML